MDTQKTYFVRGVTGPEDLPKDTTPHVAFIGRSNVGKSSTINALTNNKSLARTSNTPGRTQEINFFLFMGKIYLVDLPGYGFAKVSKEKKELIKSRILWYFESPAIRQHKVVLIIDAKVGLTADDRDMLELFESYKKDIIILANKIDKLSKNEAFTSLKKIQSIVGPHPVIPFSAEKKIGVQELIASILPQ
jgi:GTP-binding protein